MKVCINTLEQSNRDIRDKFLNKLFELCYMQDEDWLWNSYGGDNILRSNLLDLKCNLLGVIGEFNFGSPEAAKKRADWVLIQEKNNLGAIW